ncbi:hypothetical protein F5883DRAFT_146300, partial [Diaporthe sp. PMI_573]
KETLGKVVSFLIHVYNIIITFWLSLQKPPWRWGSPLTTSRMGGLHLPTNDTFSPAFGAGGDIDTPEPSVAGEAGLDEKIASCRELQIYGLQPSLPLSALALAWPSPASPGPLQGEHDQPSPAGRGSYRAGQDPAPEDVRYGRASPPGAESQPVPGLGRFFRPSLPRLEEATDREATPCRDSVGEGDGDGDGDAEPLRARQKSGRIGAALGHGTRRPSDIPGVDSDEEDQAEAMQPSDNPDDHGSP